MRVAEGSIVYEHGVPPCTGIGLAWTEEELSAGIGGRVAEVLFDEEGNAEVENMFLGEDDTGFAQDGLRQILNASRHIENWQVGEAIAETYLVDHRDCIFPWPVSRDVRKGGSSLPGADLIGIGKDTTGRCLAFGETKTSGQVRYPPNVMYGPDGLRAQLEDLRDNKATKSDLFKYLGFRSAGTSWRPLFEAAGKRYLENPSDVMLFGVLVRDVSPNEKDLQASVQQLAENCPDKTRIELVAIYLPYGRINGLGEVAAARRN